MPALELRPLSITGARREVKRLHRHLPKVVGGLFASSVWVGDEFAGVAMASEPKAPASRGKRIVEITRCATNGQKNACSMLYGALCRASAAIGYLKAITFTRLDEPGTSLRAAGFVDDGLTREQSWDRPSRVRGGELSQVRRWVKTLGRVPLFLSSELNTRVSPPCPVVATMPTENRLTDQEPQQRTEGV